MAFRSLTQNLKPHERIILAYDKSTFNLDDLFGLRSLIPHIGMVKLGMQAITARLPGGNLISSTSVAFQALDEIEEQNGSAMYDGKFKDISNTISEAIRSLVAWKRSPKIATIHATMRLASIIGALEASKGSGMLVAGVTLLTDHERSDAGAIYRSTPEEIVVACAERLNVASIDTGVSAGIVCAPKELSLLKKYELVKITPGIRDKDAPLDDQNRDRTMTAAEAIAAGADYLVIGRPIMKAQDPVVAAQEIARQIESAL